MKGATSATVAALRAHACRTAADHGDAWVEVAFDLPAGLSAEDRARATWSRVLGLRAVEGVAAAATPSFRRFARKTPNDPRYDEQWHYPLIRLPEAWDVTTGSSSVIVAVLDTGSTAHPDLAGRFVAGYDFVSDPSIAGDGNGRDTDATDPGDGEGGEPSSFHGTHVAGTIGAATNNGTGVAGVCWNVSIMPLRVLGIGGGDDADIVAAIRYAAGLSNASGRLPAQRANIVNMSLGGGGFDQAMQDAITAARNAGVVIFAAAGNEGTTAIEYPAGFDGVVAVAAVDRDRRRASYSNRNRLVDLAAPGGDSTSTEADGVLSTVYDDADGSPSATYAFYDGTSMATPHAAGVAALVLSVAPNLTPSQVESILFTTAQDLGTAGRDDSFGNGLVDAKAAVDKAKATASGAALLTLAPSSLTFEDGTDRLDAALGNAGSGTITVTRATATTTSGGAVARGHAGRRRQRRGQRHGGPRHGDPRHARRRHLCRQRPRRQQRRRRDARGHARRRERSRRRRRRRPRRRLGARRGRGHRRDGGRRVRRRRRRRDVRRRRVASGHLLPRRRLRPRRRRLPRRPRRLVRRVGGRVRPARRRPDRRRRGVRRPWTAAASRARARPVAPR